MNIPDQNRYPTVLPIKEEDVCPLDLGINGNETLLWEAYQEYKVLGYLAETGACTSEALQVTYDTDGPSLSALDLLDVIEDPFIVEYTRTNSWPEALGLGGPEELADGSATEDGTELPAYLMAGTLGSPRPHLEYGQRPSRIKQEPEFPSFPDMLGDDRMNRSRAEEKVVSKKASLKSPSRPLVERHKRHSDDDNESMSSNFSESITDGTDGSGTDGSNHAQDGRVSTEGRRKMSRRDVEGILKVEDGKTAGLPSMPKIPTVPFSDGNSKRQRRDVSMSAPAVAARELRLKKKQREDQLITDCLELKTEAETMDRDIREARAQLDRLREDAAYLRSLVNSQNSVVDLLQYLQKAPFFHKDGINKDQGLSLDGRSVLRQISGSSTEEKVETKERDGKEIGGICLHINGSNITLHLCSHCSSEAGSK